MQTYTGAILVSVNPYKTMVTSHAALPLYPIPPCTSLQERIYVVAAHNMVFTSATANLHCRCC